MKETPAVVARGIPFRVRRKWEGNPAIPAARRGIRISDSRSSGQAYEIRDPQSVAVMKNRIFVALPDGERWVFIAYLHIAATEALGNGSTRREGGR